MTRPVALVGDIKEVQRITGNTLDTEAPAVDAKTMETASPINAPDPKIHGAAPRASSRLRSKADTRKTKKRLSDADDVLAGRRVVTRSKSTVNSAPTIIDEISEDNPPIHAVLPLKAPESASINNNPKIKGT